MQLVYFWIEKYGVLENQEINFNSGFHFEMRKDNNEYILERKKEKEKKIPKIFFEEKLENISCIVGKNGSGKTTLIDAIIKQKHFKERIDFPRYIIIFEEDNELFISKNFVEVKIEFEITKLENKILNKFKYIYFNNDLNAITQNGIDNVEDISDRKKIEDTIINIENYKKDYIYGSDILKRYKQEQFKNLTIFLIENKFLIENIPYEDFKEKLQQTRKDVEIRVYLVDYIYEINKQSYENLFSKIGVIEDGFKNKFIKKSWEYICNCLIKDLDSKKINEKELLEITMRKDEVIEEWFKKVLEEVKEILKKYDNRMMELQKKSDEVKFYENLHLDSSEIKFFEFFINLILNNKKIKIEDNFFMFNYHKNPEIFDNINNSYRGYKIFNLNYNVGFSSGELAFLNLLKNLSEVRLNIEASENVIIFFEELEVFLHPEWQRKVIKLIINLKKVVPWMNNRNIQYIFTSHTPFLIGDIPGGNISYFKEGEIMRNEYETFGGNIYNILKKQFLMESCFGEFSKEKIKKVVNLLSKDENNNYKEIEIENNKEEIEFVIDSIGEDLIRNKLKKMYDNYKEYKKNSRQKINSADIEEIRKFIESKGIQFDDIINELK